MGPSRSLPLLLLVGLFSCSCGEGGHDDEDRIGPSEPGFLPDHSLRFVEHPESLVAMPGDEVFFDCRTAGGAGG